MITISLKVYKSRNNKYMGHSPKEKPKRN